MNPLLTGIGLPDWLPIGRWLDVVDIAAVAILVWLAIRYLRRTRARTALLGLGVLGLFYAAATGLDLRLTAELFRAFFAVVVLVLVVVFQEDLRRFFEQLGSWRPRRPGAEPPENTRSEATDQLVRAVVRLASQRTGALIVVPGREPPDRHLDGGVMLGGRISEPLLLSIFDASSPGHDGAIVLRDGIVERFAVHLPLSSNRAALGSRGTRHAAALGLAERCDASCIVVSEERGTVAIARNGELVHLARPQDLAGELSASRQAEPDEDPWWRRGAFVDAASAVVVAMAVWLVFVPGSDVRDATLPASIEVLNLPPEFDLEAIDPPLAEVTLRGLRRDILLANPQDLRILVDGYLARFGRRTFTLEVDDVRRPETLEVVAIIPDKIKISLRPRAEGAKP